MQPASQRADRPVTAAQLLAYTCRYFWNVIFGNDDPFRHKTRDLRSFVIRFDFESYVRFEIRIVLMVRFEIFESSALSIVIRKETIGGG